MEGLDEQIAIASRELDAAYNAAHAARSKLQGVKNAIWNKSGAGWERKDIEQAQATSTEVRNAEASLFAAHARLVGCQDAFRGLEKRFEQRRDAELKILNSCIDAFLGAPTIANAHALLAMSIPVGVYALPGSPTIWAAARALVALDALRSVRKAG